MFKAGKKIGKFSIDGNVNYITQKTSQTNSDLFDDLIQTNSVIPVGRFGELGGLNQHHWTVYANPWQIGSSKKGLDIMKQTDFMNGILRR